jgi:TM2 domain-containing membrane protein YozV
MRGVAVAKPQSGRRYAVGKNPTLATVLSIIVVGVGQFYNGDVKKGLVMLGAAFVGGLFTYGIVWLGIAIWSAFDAYQVATGKSHMW